MNHNTLAPKPPQDVATNYKFKLILKQAYYDFRKQPSFLQSTVINCVPPTWTCRGSEVWTQNVFMCFVRPQKAAIIPYKAVNLWTAVMHVFSELWMNWIFKCYLDKVWASSVFPILCWWAHCDNHLLSATLAIKHIKSGVFWDIMLWSLKIRAMFHRNTLPPYSVSKSNTWDTH